MKYSVYKDIEGGGEQLARQINKNKGHWLKFGDELFTYSANNTWQGVEDGLVSRSARVSPEIGKAKKADMHLVIQKGRVFQLEHPDVRVLFDKGRYLVVELDKTKAQKLMGREEPCFDIRPLVENSVVFEQLPVANLRSTPVDRVNHIVAALDQSLYLSTLTQLVSFNTRFSTSADYQNCALWAMDQFTAMGLSSMQQSITVGTVGQSSNVVCTIPGQGAAERKQLIITAHLDSVNHPQGPNAPAPGADDNASGSAGVLELARVMAGKTLTHDLTFVLFGGEEQGLHGSKQYLAALTDEERNRVSAVLNMDMIGSVNTPQQTVLLEGATVSQNEMDELAAAAATYTSLQVQTSLNPFASDHVPFIEAGIPAVLTIEGADSANQNIHTAADTLDTVTAPFAVEILKMNAAFIAQRAELVAESDVAAPGDCGCSDGDEVQELTAQQRQFLLHCQQLNAQYSRLHQQGALMTQQYADWQGLVQLHDLIQQSQ